MSLKFKGETKKKKRSHRESRDGDKGEGSSSGLTWQRRYGKDVEGWTLALSADDLVGPLFITSKSSLSKDGHPLALATNPINFRAYPYVMDKDMTAEAGEPTTVDSIWRCARLPESDDCITLKSAQDRFLATDQYGTVTADREARGVPEEFVVESAEEQGGKGAFAIRSSAYNKYLSLDEVAGGKLELRCDAESIGADETWYIKMQAEYLGKTEEERRKKQRLSTVDEVVVMGNVSAAEAANIKKYQARIGSKHGESSEGKAALRKAQQEGRMAEEMLDRRRKLKSDRYC